MTIEDMFSNDNMKSELDNYIRRLYYNDSYAYLRRHMELDDFTHELYIYILRYKHMLTNDTPLALAKWIAKKKASRISSSLTTDKRLCNNIDSNISINNYTPSDSECSLAEVLEDKPHSFFEESEAIEYSLKYVPSCDRDICKLHLLGYKQKDILNFCDYTPRQLQYRLQKMYRPLMQRGYKEYMENLL